MSLAGTLNRSAAEDQEPTEDALLPSDAANEDEPHIVRGYN
ncbi:hypothetical protein A8924_3199 [Saccharopolyspora erythraea NRRL 2338]|uniref:Uncharacterized protein n=2 Tax=Saccharopolyspora erythraea TaxID=1836 RepID=A4FDG3_SACEN|nr:hypothetical protein [Saccharopolyspora erythraea]EQD81814.1 hypothetical protein N599_34040 [Saccharopolyspora erythraea D]PFG95827.1 hypothetical protein A8924_3199 [Saccharopolyspora erythraea NRRL 2338]CAM02088.1 hypothetical protein SACE_2809 [Saccharopolyspora erythraea NRRL 2338]